jgi:hypothetical protein
MAAGSLILVLVLLLVLEPALKNRGRRRGRGRAGNDVEHLGDDFWQDIRARLRDDSRHRNDPERLGRPTTSWQLGLAPRREHDVTSCIGHGITESEQFAPALVPG